MVIISSKVTVRRNGDENELFKTLNSKSIFSFQFIANVEKLNYNEELERGDFYNSLNGENIFEEDFIYYLKVWDKLKRRHKVTILMYSYLMS